MAADVGTLHDSVGHMPALRMEVYSTLQVLSTLAELSAVP
jgi:hypothetical protein